MKAANNATLNAAAYQQLLAQELGLCSKKVIKKRTGTGFAGSSSRNQSSGPSGFRNLPNRKPISNLVRSDAETKLVARFEKFFNISASDSGPVGQGDGPSARSKSKISSCRKKSSICAWMVKRLLTISRSESQRSSESYESVQNLAEILNQRKTPKKLPETKETFEILLKELVDLASKRKNLQSCPICLENLDPFKGNLSITNCCTSVFHGNCIKSLINLASRSKKATSGSRSITGSETADFYELQTFARRIEERLEESASASTKTKFSISCPVCRSDDESFRILEIRPSYLASLKIITNAAVKIQSYFRGHLCRINSSSKIFSHFARQPRLKSLEKRILSEKQSLMSSIDENLRFQADLIKQFEKMHVDWEKIRANSVSKGWHKTCSICMELNFAGVKDAVENSKARSLALTAARNQKVKILHCGHCFHEVCLGSWVIYKNMVEICPLCRENFFSEDLCF